MRNSSANPTTDFRLEGCKHDRLRAALEFRPRSAAAVTVAIDEVVQAAAANVPVASPKRSGKGLVGGAVAMMGLSFCWFLVASFSSVDFSVYETDTSVPQVVQTVPTSVVIARS